MSSSRAKGYHVGVSPADNEKLHNLSFLGWGRMGQPIESSRLALLWQILSGGGFPNQFFNDSWVVGFLEGRPWVAGRRIGKKSLDAFLSHFWIGWGTSRGDKCVHSTWLD
jgi:hypothetical protein